MQPECLHRQGSLAARLSEWIPDIGRILQAVKTHGCRARPSSRAISLMRCTSVYGSIASCAAPKTYARTRLRLLASLAKSAEAPGMTLPRRVSCAKVPARKPCLGCGCLGLRTWASPHWACLSMLHKQCGAFRRAPALRALVSIEGFSGASSPFIAATSFR